MKRDALPEILLSCPNYCPSLKAFAPMLTYIRPAVVAVGTLMMLIGVYELAGWWGLLTASGATLLLYGALG